MSAEQFSLTKRILDAGEPFEFVERLRSRLVSEARCRARLGLVAVLRLAEPLPVHPTLRRSPVVQVVSGAPLRSNDSKARSRLPQESEWLILPRQSPSQFGTPSPRLVPEQDVVEIAMNRHREGLRIGGGRMRRKRFNSADAANSTREQLFAKDLMTIFPVVKGGCRRGGCLSKSRPCTGRQGES